jgi:uncharacterized membrane protein YfcA
MTPSDWLLTVLFAVMALLYSSVGHAGSSGYQASMALVGFPDALMKPTALCMNILVAAIAWFQFGRQGCFDRRLFVRLMITSSPMAFVGGMWTLPAGVYYWLVAIVLWLAALRLSWSGLPPRHPPHPPSDKFLLLVGAGLGLVSGMTGTGGGIFLTPFLVIMGWATPRIAAGVSAAIILVNSLAGITGWYWNTTEPALPALLPLWMVVVGVFGVIGSWFGSRYGSPLLLRRLLALVLVIAGIKMTLM